ncbi:hypothetical protein [Mycobacteroides abscessus]|uniref:hypothetical protein n=1 Tax=Mycobacteroides abscessus TaxID=36809 RepID=UPI0019D2DC9E|nr:hypothetical protein [Mycobacteroides abscessus]MBN7481025.1 hypothetical protein [Mycobacteroides abscessus subsp. massiliense]
MAYLNARQRQERAYVLRELLLRPALKRRENPSTDYIAAVTDLTDEMVVTATNGVLSVSVTDMLGKPSDHRHDLIAAARLIMGNLETSPGRASTRAHLTAGLAHRGFTSPTIDAAIAWLTEQSLITVTNGTVTDISGDRRPTQPRSPLPAELLAPRTPAPSTSAPSTPATRPNMSVGNLIEHPEQRVDMGKRMQEQAAQMPSASFEVGDVPVAKPAPKKPAPAAPTIPDSAITALLTAVLDAFARVGKPTVTWSELGVKRVELGDLPEGWTPERVLQTVIKKMSESGELRDVGDGAKRTFTYVPAEKAVSEVATYLTRFFETTAFDVHTRADLHRDARFIAVPDGWSAATITDLALTKLVDAGTLTVDGDVFTRVVKPEPKPKSEPVAPAPEPKPAPAPAGDTTSEAPDPKPSGSATVASASGQVPQGKKSESAKSDTEKPPRAPTLEKRLDVLTGEVRAIGARLHTLPAPPSAEKVLLDEADADVKMLLESVCVRLKLDGPQRDSPLHRVLPGKAKPTRSNPDPIDRRLRLGEALTLGVDAKILAHDPLTRTYRLITATPLMSKAALDRRVQRIKDMREDAKEKNKNKGAA